MLSFFKSQKSLLIIFSSSFIMNSLNPVNPKLSKKKIPFLDVSPENSTNVCLFYQPCQYSLLQADKMHLIQKANELVTTPIY